MVDIKDFYFDNIEKKEYHYQFYETIRDVNVVNNVFEGEREIYDYGFYVYDVEEAIRIFRGLCQPNVIFDKEKKCWFYLLAYYLHKCGYEIKEFPRILARPPVDPIEFTYNDIRNYIISNGDDDNGTVRFSTRRLFVSNLTFISSKGKINGMSSALELFPTEKLLLYNQSGDVYEVIGLIGTDTINSEDVSIPIEIDDIFERFLPSGVSEYYKVTDSGYYRGTPGIPAGYQTKVVKIKNPFWGKEVNNDMQGSKCKPTRIFITHSSNDREFVGILTDLLRKLRVPSDSIICTSDPKHRIPNGENTYEWLRKQFINSKLHMIFMLSENYYNSVDCLNEMGAAWLTANKSDLLLLPGFGFDDLKKKKGCLDKYIQAGSMDSDDLMLKAWLMNLRDDVIDEFGLKKPDELDWEEYRNSFITGMKSISNSFKSKTIE